MRFPAAILIAACALAAGCTSLASRTRERDRDRHDRTLDRRDDDRPWWIEGTGTAGRDKSRPMPAAIARNDREGIIAGEVVDAREGRRLSGKTFIIVRPADEVAPAGGRGGNVGVETDDDGYFFMPGLVPGKTYILSVTREVNGRKVAGEAQVKPPAGNIRLELDEGKLSSIAPPLPPPPGMGPFERTNGLPESGSGSRDEPPPLPPPPLRSENIAGNPTLPPTAAIRPPPSPAPPGPWHRPQGEPPSTSRSPLQRVPNFRVSDVIGRDWEFNYADGQLILMAFWSTTCEPCKRAMPAMKRLQSDYGRSGLEIVAVACEADAPFETRARDVEEVARRNELNYKVYVEREGRVGEMQRLFELRFVPSLVLLDRRGAVLWQGGATEADMARLDDIVRSYLTRR
jgi:thiol-disulfide isomerase/thioredoxin